jgi:hypothetical protein
MSKYKQLELFQDFKHPYKYGGKWANECECGAHWLDKIHTDYEEVLDD